MGSGQQNSLPDHSTDHSWDDAIDCVETVYNKLVAENAELRQKLCFEKNRNAIADVKRALSETKIEPINTEDGAHRSKVDSRYTKETSNTQEVLRELSESTEHSSSGMEIQSVAIIDVSRTTKPNNGSQRPSRLHTHGEEHSSEDQDPLGLYDNDQKRLLQENQQLKEKNDQLSKDNRQLRIDYEQFHSSYESDPFSKRYQDERQLRLALNERLVGYEGHMQTLARIRVQLTTDRNPSLCFTRESGGIVHAVGTSHRFCFSKVLDDTDSNADVWHEVEPLVNSAMQNSRLCIFMVGATNSGKTHTMAGPRNDPESEQRGIIPRTVTHMVGLNKERRKHRQPLYNIEVSVVEVYDYGEKKHIKDLQSGCFLQDWQDKDAWWTGHSKSSPNSQVVQITGEGSLNDTAIYKRLQSAASKRINRKMNGHHGGSNSDSSRSVIVYTLKLVPPTSTNHDVKSSYKGGTITLVDLPGSEKTPDGSDKLAADESRSIKEMLSAVLPTIAQIRRIACSIHASKIRAEGLHVQPRHTQISNFPNSGAGSSGKLDELRRMFARHPLLKVLYPSICIKTWKIENLPRVLLLCTFAGWETTQKDVALRFMQQLRDSKLIEEKRTNV